MAKSFPYFKFIATEWMTGNIVYEPFAVQGLFINVCALYWQRDGVLSLNEIRKRYKDPIELDNLVNGFIELNDGMISIQFLDEQLIDANHISKVRSEAGIKGQQMKANAKQMLNKNQQRKEEVNKNKRKEEVNKNKAFVPPCLTDVKLFFEENGYLGAEKAWQYYEDGNWTDTNGKQVINWKQKMRVNWFKEKKQPEQTRDYTGSRNDLNK